MKHECKTSEDPTEFRKYRIVLCDRGTFKDPIFNIKIRDIRPDSDANYLKLGLSFQVWDIHGHHRHRRFKQMKWVRAKTRRNTFKEVYRAICWGFRDKRQLESN